MLGSLKKYDFAPHVLHFKREKTSEHSESTTNEDNILATIVNSRTVETRRYVQKVDRVGLYVTILALLDLLDLLLLKWVC